jgi:hypothetical protein
MEDELTFRQIIDGLSAPIATIKTMCVLVEALVSESTCSLLLVEPNGTFRYGAGLLSPSPAPAGRRQRRCNR